MSRRPVPGVTGNSVGQRGGAGGVFVAHLADDLGGGSDELDVAAGADFGEAGILGKESVAGVNGVRFGDFGGGEDAIGLEVAILAGSASDANGLVGELHVHGIDVGFGVNRDRRDPEFAASADDAKSDFPAVRDENFGKHKDEALLDAEQGVPVLNWAGVVDTDFADGAGTLGFDFVHHLHGLDDAESLAFADGGADFDKGGGVGRRLVVEGADHGRGDFIPTSDRGGAFQLGGGSAGKAAGAMQQRERSSACRRGRFEWPRRRGPSLTSHSPLLPRGGNNSAHARS